MDALERFRKEFKRWVTAHNRAKNFNSDPDEILERLEQKVPETMLRQIGGAYINGWLRNENGQDRGYFVKETDRKEPRGGQWMLENAGEGKVNPCWELYVQLSDYARLRTIAERQGLVTRLEDNLMDITVYAGERLLLYVENKTEEGTALHLLKHMKEYGKKGFSLDDPDRKGDNIWISVGSGKTAYNFYIHSERGDAVILGMYEDGRIWTDLIGIGDEIANRLSKDLKNIGVALEKTKQWQFWRRDNRLLNLHDEDPVDIAKWVVTAYLA